MPLKQTNTSTPSKTRKNFPIKSRSWKRLTIVAATVLVALVPKAACPACWPAYFGLLGAVGISLVVDFGPYLFPLTLLALLTVLGTFGYRARRRHGYGPLALGILASALILISKAALPPTGTALYVGIVLLIGASIWNAWPIHHKKTGGQHRSCHNPPSGRM